MATKQTPDLSVPIDPEHALAHLQSAGLPARHPVPAAAVPTIGTSVGALTFETTAPGQNRFLILRLTQTHAASAITLTTDAPEQFQLACDSRPAFGSSLTLTPPEGGAYVHVRYSPTKTGLHTGHLFIESPFASLTVDLTARSSGLRALRRVGTADPLLTSSSVQSLFSSARLWLIGLALLTVGGLAYLGYSKTHDGTAAKSHLTAEAAAKPVSRSTTRPVSPIPKPVGHKRPVPEQAAPKQVTEQPLTPVKQAPQPVAPITIDRTEPVPVVAGPTDPPTSKRTTSVANRVPIQPKARPAALMPPNKKASAPEPQPEPIQQPASVAPTPRPQATPPARSGEESDLERVLNKKP